MKIVQATIENLEDLAPLFDGYRVFYKQPSDLEKATHFLTERFQKNDSVIFMAFEGTSALGFTQLYPSFSSVSMQRTYILNDLFVASGARGKGVGETIMNKAKAFAISEKAKGITLETDVTNPAQKLYERLGWTKDTEVFHYTWKV
ncbi:GNAT family N-acetyltransferase [Aureisphaera sp. CAU 1614]|uniref:GNAT family N-acetyltransferase n=1 Tax=Halomarinibacterium sedimenti TaxID=2857106 RepID=A0A9X1FPP0_9FLAO|nr:GNAT family N-acetyltransferase [Halomarinibacterium sedimenti]MBW2938424.1 GNAT family N-acetyltransferase [Halomarinibacterium sedimenti]